VMPLLEADLTGVDNYNPYGSLHLELDNSENTASTLHLKFQTENTTGGQFLTAAYVYTLDESGNKSVMTKVFETVPNIFNWMNVKLFYDVYNDVYNVTIGQYAIDFGEDWLKTPVSTIIRGDQYNQETYELTNEKSIITELYSDVMKGRYCPTNLINSLDIWLETTKNTPLEESSEAYIDNLELRTWHFPAVYADTVLANKDISSYDPNGISFMNNSIISCYEPPKYPLENVDISLNTEYLLNAKNPSHMTPWLYAPSWVYAIPPVLTSDHDINVRSLMHIINNVEKPLEERGIYDPKAESMYGTEPEKRLNAQYFEYNESGSDVYKYRFDARYGSQYFQVELFDDLEREGMVKSIQLYNKSMNEDFLLFDFNYQYFGSFYGEEQEFIPGFPFEMILLIAGCSIFFLIRIGDKGKKSE